MTKYIDQELARYWPVSPELLEQYRDGSHTAKDWNGTLFWENKNSQRHRDGDLPAIIGANGQLEWFQNGQHHRDGDLPAIIGANGYLGWCQNGQHHRDGDKPAIIGADGYLGWCQNGQYHRLHGPARILVNDEIEWWINGEDITQEVNFWLDGEKWQGTPEQIFEFQLRFA